MIRRVNRNENNRNYRIMRESSSYNKSKLLLIYRHEDGHRIGCDVTDDGVSFDGRYAHFDSVLEDGSIVKEQISVKDIVYIG